MFRDDYRDYDSQRSEDAEASEISTEEEGESKSEKEEHSVEVKTEKEEHATFIPDKGTFVIRNGKDEERLESDVDAVIETRCGIKPMKHYR